MQALTDGNWDYIGVFSYDNMNGSAWGTDQFPGVPCSGYADFGAYHIDGIGIDIQGWNSFFESLDFDLMVEYSVPEPSSILALLCGLGGLTLWRRRR